MNTYQHKVQYYETDQMGIVHHSNYIRWMEEARVDFLSQKGWEYKKMEKLGVVSPVTAIEGKYKRSAKFDDTVSVAVFVADFRGVRLCLKYEVRDSEGTLLFIGKSEHCFMDREGNILNMKKAYPDFYAAVAAEVQP